MLAGGPPLWLYTYLVYHLYTLCIYTTIYVFGGLPTMSKIRPPTTMVESNVSDFTTLVAVILFVRIRSIIWQLVCGITKLNHTRHSAHNIERLEPFTSASFLAEISVGSPQKLFILIIKKTYFLDQSIQNTFYLVLKKEALPFTHIRHCLLRLFMPAHVRSLTSNRWDVLSRTWAGITKAVTLLQYFQRITLLLPMVGNASAAPQPQRE